MGLVASPASLRSAPLPWGSLRAHDPPHSAAVAVLPSPLLQGEIRCDAPRSTGSGDPGQRAPCARLPQPQPGCLPTAGGWFWGKTRLVGIMNSGQGTQPGFPQGMGSPRKWWHRGHRVPMRCQPPKPSSLQVSGHGNQLSGHRFPGLPDSHFFFFFPFYLPLNLSALVAHMFAWRWQGLFFFFFPKL